MDKLKTINEIQGRIKEESTKETPDKKLINEMVRDLMLLGIGLDNLNINGNFKMIP